MNSKKNQISLIAGVVVPTAIVLAPNTAMSAVSPIISFMNNGVSHDGSGPAEYDSDLGTLAVQNLNNQPGMYAPAYLKLPTYPNGETAGYVSVTGFLPGDEEVFALQVKVNGVTATASQLLSIVADIDHAEANFSTVGLIAGSQYAPMFPGYNIYLQTDVPSDSLGDFLGFDFSNSGTDTTDIDTALGPVTVSSIAAVPEPSCAAITGIASTLLLRRRRNPCHRSL